MWGTRLVGGQVDPSPLVNDADAHYAAGWEASTSTLTGDPERGTRSRPRSRRHHDRAALLTDQAGVRGLVAKVRGTGATRRRATVAEVSRDYSFRAAVRARGRSAAR